MQSSQYRNAHCKFILYNVLNKTETDPENASLPETTVHSLDTLALHRNIKMTTVLLPLLHILYHYPMH